MDGYREAEGEQAGTEAWQKGLVTENSRRGPFVLTRRPPVDLAGEKREE